MPLATTAPLARSPGVSIDSLAPVVTSVALTGSTGDVNHRLNAGDTLNAHTSPSMMW
jgi:hypothetical protein